MSQIQFYNTYSKCIEPFESIEPEKVKIYSCGPTVYSHPHIGNFRSFRTRAGNTHFAAQHVNELGKFVDAPTPHETTDFQYAAVTLLDESRFIVVGLFLQGSEFEEGEGPSETAEALLTVEYRESTAQCDCNNTEN